MCPEVRPWVPNVPGGPRGAVITAAQHEQPGNDMISMKIIGIPENNYEL